MQVPTTPAVGPGEAVKSAEAHPDVVNLAPLTPEIPIAEEASLGAAPMRHDAKFGGGHAHSGAMGAFNPGRRILHNDAATRRRR